MEDWAEIRRLRRAEGVPIKEIARRLGIARNTVRAALASERPPKYERRPRGSVVDGYERQIRALLPERPGMPAPDGDDPKSQLRTSFRTTTADSPDISGGRGNCFTR